LPVSWRQYTYDNASHLLTEYNSLGGVTANYQGDKEGNRYGTQVSPENEVTDDGIWHYNYNLAGQETSQQRHAGGDWWLFNYDVGGRLTQAQHKPSTNAAVDVEVDFRYDALGNRTQQT